MKTTIGIALLLLVMAGYGFGEGIAEPGGMVRVEGGTFLMGSDDGGEDDERPAHTVTVNSFYMAKYEVTQKEWYEVMGTTVRQQRDMRDKSYFLAGEGDDYPMYYVSWHEAVEYCNKRSIKEGLTPAYTIDKSRKDPNDTNDYDDDVKWLVTWNRNANGYRLPTEAEWEYAAKGGSRDPMVYEYAGSNSVDAVAWYSGNSGNSTQPVGKKAPNSLGLYDMSGNVWEWCWDWYGDYASGEQTDPIGASSGSSRVARGGDWDFPAQYVCSAYYNTPSFRGSDLGFRVVRSAQYGDYPSGAQTGPIGASSGSYRVVRGGSWGCPAQGVRSACRGYNTPSAQSTELGFRLVRNGQ